jgi:hypothetical protein
MATEQERLASGERRMANGENTRSYPDRYAGRYLPFSSVVILITADARDAEKSADGGARSRRLPVSAIWR